MPPFGHAFRFALEIEAHLGLDVGSRGRDEVYVHERALHRVARRLAREGELVPAVELPVMMRWRRLDDMIVPTDARYVNRNDPRRAP